MPEQIEPHLEGAPGTARPGRVRRPGETTIPDSIHRAAEELLGEAPPEKLTVSRILERAGVSRTSFYYYFPSKDAALASLLERIVDEVGVGPARWGAHRGAEPDPAIRDALDAAFRVWERHAALLRVVQDAPRAGSSLGAIWHELVEQRWVRPLALQLRRDQDAGRLPRATDPLALARALCWMSERTLFDHVAGEQARDRAARRAAVDALTLIWRRSLEAQDAR